MVIEVAALELIKAASFNEPFVAFTLQVGEVPNVALNVTTQEVAPEFGVNVPAGLEQLAELQVVLPVPLQTIEVTASPDGKVNC
jgi:hypothetical protein